MRSCKIGQDFCIKHACLLGHKTFSRGLHQPACTSHITAYCLPSRPGLPGLIPSRVFRSGLTTVAAALAAERSAGSSSHCGGGGSSRSSSSSHDSSSWQELVMQQALDPEQLVRLNLKAKITTKPEQQLPNVSNKSAAAVNSSSSSAAPSAAAAAGSDGMPYKLLTMRPVMLKGKLQLQLSLLDARQDTTKNYQPDQARDVLAQLLQLPWQSATLITHQQTTSIQISRKGKVLIQTATPKPQTQPSSSSNDPRPAQPPAAAAAASPAAVGTSSTSTASRGLAPVQLAAGAAAGPLISLQHDRVKALPINGSVADPFLQRTGLQTADGRIKANMQAKFTQINEFLKLLIHTGELEHIGQQAAAAAGAGNETPITASSRNSSSSSSVHILDCGCGSSHLTFGTYHYLHHVRSLPVKLTGIDTNAALMARSNRYCEELGVADAAQFHTAPIRSFAPEQRPDIVLALHACDTATDEALALGVRCRSSIIMSVPCCHKDLHRQQQQQQQQQGRQKGGRSGSSSSSVDLFDPLLSHGILRQRLLDLLTDTFRAHLLRLAGFRTDVVEFVSTEHTPRNLLIRAVKQQRQLPEAEQSRLVAEYLHLKQYWGVVPHLEKLMREDALLPAAVLNAIQS